MLKLSLIFLLPFFLLACGQKGDLYMPKDPAGKPAIDANEPVGNDGMVEGIPRVKERD